MFKSLLRKKNQKKQEKLAPKVPTILEQIQAEMAETQVIQPLNTPEEWGKEMKQLSLKYDNYPPYFDCLNLDSLFMRPFVKKSADYIIQNISNKASRILDICGGPGNQGLALAKEGFTDYTVADIDENRMGWGELLWYKSGRKLNWRREDVLHMTCKDESYDVITLLGWEAPSLAYSYTLKECLRVLKPGGYLIFTYHEMDEMVEGNWDFDPERTYSFLPYSISRAAVNKLCQAFGLEVLGEDTSGYPPQKESFFPDDTPRLFPQYIVYTQKKK